MKKQILILMVIANLSVVSVTAQERTESFKVFGNCGMCKSRIEKATKMDGVTAAKWNKDTKMLSMTFNPEITTVNKVQQSIAAAGHDTEKYEANTEVYEKLPGCCHYDRKKKQENSPSKQDH